MGNFGKRILIILLAAVAFVTLALVGNAYQQAERVHKVSKSNSVVYQGSYDGKSYELTKEEIWKAMVNSDAMDNVVEILNMYLLESVINSVSTEEIAAKKEYLIYGTNDADTIAEYSKAENSESNEKLMKAFTDKMAVLGYSENGGEGHDIEDYCKYLVACDKYARYRLENEKSISGTTYDLKDETLKEDLEDGYKDTYAIAIKFYSEADAKSFVITDDSNLCVVSSEIRYYTGDSKYKVKSVKNVLATTQEDAVNYVEQSGAKVPNTSYVSTTTDEDGNTVYETLDKTIYDNITEFDQEVIWKSSETTASAVYALFWDESNQKWISKKVAMYVEQTDPDTGETLTDETTGETLKELEKLTSFTTRSFTYIKPYNEQTSFTSSNSISLSDAEFLRLYIYLYNNYYTQHLGKSVPELVDNTAFDLTNEELIAELKELGYAVVNDTIRKYVGNEEYVVEGSEDGYPTYKQYAISDSSKVNIPNYKIKYKEDQVTPDLDSDNNFQYELDSDGNKIPNDDKKAIADVTEFTLENTIEINAAQLYALYIQLVAKSENLLYNYEDVNASRSTFATKLFETLSANTKGGAYLKSYSSVESSSSSSDPYYLIFKLSDSTKEEKEPTAEELAKLKEDKIQEYLTATGFVDACMAELRAEAGMVTYDKFFAFDYESSIVYNSSSNTYGAKEDDIEDYFKTKGYKAKKVAALTKKVKVESLGINKGKYTVTSDELYNYSMEYSAASYITSAASTKILTEVMPEFTQIHGNSKDYLTSKNWLMELYAQTIQNYNYQYEYYKQLYAAYGYSYYDSLDEYLNGYGARSYDDIVVQLEKSTMKNVLIYKEMVGALNTTTLTEYGKSVLTNANEKFASYTKDYMDLDVNHLLIGIDLDEDGSPDDYDDFLASIEDGSVKLTANGIDPITAIEYEALVDELYALIKAYVGKNSTSLSTVTSALSSIVTEYNDSSRVDGDYAEFKAYGLTLKNETFEVSQSTLENYDKAFQKALVKLQEKLVRVDNDLLGYSLYDGLCRSSFGDHLILAAPCDSLVAPSFAFAEKDAANPVYAAGTENENDEISESQAVLYLQQQIYTNLFGSTDKPEEKAAKSGYTDFYYPNLPTTLTNDIADLYGEYYDLLLDSSNSYHSTYLILKHLVNDNNAYKSSLETLLNIYKEQIFE